MVTFPLNFGESMNATCPPDKDGSAQVNDQGQAIKGQGYYEAQLQPKKGSLQVYAVWDCLALWAEKYDRPKESNAQVEYNEI